MKRLAFLLILIPSFLLAGPKVWNKTGTATATSATLTVGSTSTPFNPAGFCIKNTGGTNNLFFNFTPPAVATDDTLNFIVEPGLEYCIDFSTQLFDTTVAVIAEAGLTTTYSMKAVADR